MKSIISLVQTCMQMKQLSVVCPLNKATYPHIPLASL